MKQTNKQFVRYSRFDLVVAEMGPHGRNDGVSSFPPVGRTTFSGRGIFGRRLVRNGPTPKVAVAARYLEADCESSLVDSISS